MIDKNKIGLEEKIKLLSGKSGDKVAEKYGMRFPSMSDGPHGVTRLGTCYPNMCLVSCSWDKELICEMGKSIGNDCVENGVDVLLGPSVNIKRNPLCGRNFEYISEDPYLAGEMGAAYINGLQSTGTAACVKHFCCYNQETDRFTQNVFVDEDVLMDVYVRVFKIILRRSAPRCLMTSYNSVNGELVSENKRLIKSVLRGMLGYKGVIMTDWGGVDFRGKSISAGVNINMPGDYETSYKEVLAMIERGEISEKDVNDCVDAVIGLLKPVGHKEKVVAADKRKIKELTCDGMVLLKNDGVLPLKKAASFAVVGALAKDPKVQGGGCAFVRNASLKTPYDELCDRAGKKLSYAAGYSVENGKADESKVSEALAVASDTDTVIFFTGLLEWNESEGYDRASLDIPENQINALKALKNDGKKIITIVTNGSAVALGEISEYSDAVLECWYAGDLFAEAMADILYGKSNPCGRLAESFPKSLDSYIPKEYYVDDGDCVRYGEGKYVGYKYYLHTGGAVEYPFGFGLSYTSFEYSDMVLRGSLGENDLRAELTVKNVGKSDGKDVVQIYMSGIGGVRSLCGFEKVFLKAGECGRVSVSIDKEAFSEYSARSRAYELRGGKYKIELCRDAQTPVLSCDIDVPSEFKCTRYTRIDELRRFGNGPELISKYFSECVGEAVLGVDDYKIKFNGREIDDVPFVRNVTYSLPLYIFTTLTSGKLDNKELDEIIYNINRELIYEKSTVDMERQ